MSIIQMTDVTKTYGNVLALDNISLKVEQGQIYGFIGPNGAGKTTTIRILLGILKADSGVSTINDLDCW
ncbi:MAG TPA: ATP-binding cassette domain-containing protein, partial [Bacillota bacterium]|nr:ATP-binding cassette domain-containing protein [Bacillota bacterium]